MTKIIIFGIDLANAKDCSISIHGISSGKSFAIKQAKELMEQGKVSFPKNNTMLLNKLKNFTYNK